MAESGANSTDGELSAKEIIAVADKIGHNGKLSRLGVELGFGLERITAFQRSNYQNGEVTNRGTLSMLEDWQKGVKIENQRRALAAALEAAGLVAIAQGTVRTMCIT